MDAAGAPNSLAARDRAFLLHGYTDPEKLERDGPFVIAHGKGIRLYDDQGREFIESMGGLWCVTLGYGNERLAEVAARQMRELSYGHSFGGRSHPAQIELAEMLIERSPPSASGGPFSRAFFANSGSEANDTAIKFAWYHFDAAGQPRRRKIIGRHKAYHGVTVAAASATGQPHVHAGFGLPLPGFLHTDCPHFARFGLAGESEEAFSDRLAGSLDALIRREDPDTIAAFIAEPVMGAGGMIPPPAGYFPRIRNVLDRYGILMIADEVITGFGRTGAYWGSQTYDIRPHMITTAKGLSSGYIPISAVLIDETVYRAIAAGAASHGTLAHGFTYSGHPVAAAVAVECLKIYDEIDVVGRVRALAPSLAAMLAGHAGHRLIGETATVGLLGVAELVADKENRVPFDPAHRVGARLARIALNQGLILRTLGDRIAFAPPVIATVAEIEDIGRRFGRALDDAAIWLDAGSPDG